VEGWTVSSTSGKLGKLNLEDVPERLRPHIERSLDRPSRLKPLLGQPLGPPRLKGDSRRRRLKASVTDLAPWELAELEYVEGMKGPSRSQQLCNALLERYCEPSKEPVCGFEISAPHPVVPNDAVVIANGVPVRPKPVETSGSWTPTAPTNSSPPMLLPSTPSTPRHREGSRLLPASLPLKHAVFSRVTPLTLPGMKIVPQTAAPPNFTTGISRAITPVKIMDNLHVPDAAEAHVVCKSPLSSSPTPSADHLGERRLSSSKTKWNVLSPFLSFLKRPRKANAEDESNEPLSPNSLYSAHVAGGPSDNAQLQSEAAANNSAANNMSGKTLGLIDGIQRWMTVADKNASQIPQQSGLALEITSAGDKAEIRSLIVLAKKYNLPVNDVREMKREFAELDKEGSGEISWADFQSLVRKRGNLPADKAIPAHLLQGMADRQPKSMMGEDGKDAFQDVGFEEYLRWTIQVAWSEEMLMPCPEERTIRQLARDQGMLLPDVERVKQLFDTFDTDGSGEIEEEEFRHILYKMLNVRDVSDVPIKRLERYWREVDLDGSGCIGFNEFLIWYKTSFSKDGKIDL